MLWQVKLVQLEHEMQAIRNLNFRRADRCFGPLERLMMVQEWVVGIAYNRLAPLGGD